MFVENRTAPLKQVIATENAGQQALQSLLRTGMKSFDSLDFLIDLFYCRESVEFKNSLVASPATGGSGYYPAGAPVTSL